MFRRILGLAAIGLAISLATAATAQRLGGPLVVGTNISFVNNGMIRSVSLAPIPIVGPPSASPIGTPIGGFIRMPSNGAKVPQAFLAAPIVGSPVLNSGATPIGGFTRMPANGAKVPQGVGRAGVR